MTNSYTLKLPKLEFGPGKVRILGQTLKSYGGNVLLITGARSHNQTGLLQAVFEDFVNLDINHYHTTVSNEPSPDMIDSIVTEFRGADISSVCAIGGGSSIDTAKAVAAMLTEKVSVVNFLETIGKMTPSGSTLPVVAVPTTAGTGTEATKNAVLSNIGKKGFKKSIRHDKYIPLVAIVDPELTLSCPRGVTAASGADALLQLIESYISTRAFPFTDAVALDSIKRILRSLPPACTIDPKNIALRADISYGAFISGVTLAHAGLCTAHGLAAEIGANVRVPHGSVCGNLLSPWVEKTVRKLQKEKKNEHLLKFAEIGKFFTDKPDEPLNVLLDKLIEGLQKFIKDIDLTPLNSYDFSDADIEYIAQTSSDKFNPVPFTVDERMEIIRMALK